MKETSVKQNILKFLEKFANNTFYVDSLIVSVFASINALKIEKNIFLKKYILPINNIDLIVFLQLIGQELNSEQLVSMFEFIVSPSDKIVTGAVYTPEYIRKYIVEKVLKGKKLTKKTKIADISCGCGGFLLTTSQYIKSLKKISYKDIFKDNIWGLDIKEYSIERTKIMLSLLAASQGEDENFHFNLFIDNALTKKWDEKFDIIVGNPPYVHVRNMDSETKELLKKWSVTKSGGTDLYLAFFQIAIENLVPNGILGYITVSSFIQSLNGQAIRTYLHIKELGVDIIHFGDEQVFLGKTTYTCLCFITNTLTSKINFVKCSPLKLNELNEQSFDTLNYASLDAKKGWVLRSTGILSVIERIENIGMPLGQKIAIRNGFATLKNDVYLFKPTSKDDTYFYFNKKGETFSVEKSICKEAIKANILKQESDIDSKKEYLIFPYEFIIQSSKNVRINIIQENILKEKYPQAHKYLLCNQSLLSQRDKGNKKYETWYAFGRRQALYIPGNKLLFAYISEKPVFLYSENTELLFYNGYALVSNDKEELLWLKKLLESTIFAYYIRKTSRHYSNNFFALAKNYIQNFGVPNLHKKQLDQLKILNKQEEIDAFFLEIYKLDKIDIQ